MFLMLSRILSRSNCIMILVIFNLASSAPLKSQTNSPFQNERGFSGSPKILEIQLPLKITSKDDLVAWSKYVMSLMASKINLATISKSLSSVEKRFPFTSNSDSRSKETTMMRAPLGEKRQGLNYPARRLKEPPVPRADEKVMAYPLPIGAMQPTTTPNPLDPFSLSSLNINRPTDFGQFVGFNPGNPFQQSEFDTFANFDALLQPPANTYLPLSPINTVKPYQNTAGKNISGLEEPAKLQTVSNSLNFQIKTHNNEFGQALPIDVNNELFTGVNLSHIGDPLFTFPFQAYITISKEPPAATIIQPKDHTTSKDLPNEFLPYFDRNYTLLNEAGQADVVFNDFVATTSETKTEEKVKKGKEREKQREQNVRGQKKQNQKKTASARKQKPSNIKRQSAILGDLLRTLGILRKVPKNSTEINVATPILSILKGTNSQKIQVAFEETPPNRGRRNETFLAQQLDGNDDDDENDDNGNGNNGNGDNGNGDDGNGDDGNGDDGNDDIENGDTESDGDEDGPEAEAQEDDDEEEEEGGSIQAIIDLLPLAAPILEELSDPEAEVDIVEVLQGAIPLLEGLSDPEEEGGVDIPAVLLPLSQKISGGPEGQSDSGAILGPIIQLIAPLSGPLSGPLIAPLSRSSSGPQGAQGSASVFSASAEPLSKPQGPYGQSVFSGLVASIVSKLSKESSASAGDSDVKSLVSSLVSGLLAGSSAGSSGHKHKYGTSYGQNATSYGQNTYGGYGPNRDTYHASTSYGYGGQHYGPRPTEAPDSSAAVKEILNAFLKLSATSSTSSASLSGASSSSSTGLSASSSQSSKEPERPTYGPPTYGQHTYGPQTYSYPTQSSYAGPPPSYAPASTSSPYVSYTRRQVARQQKKKT